MASDTTGGIFASCGHEVRDFADLVCVVYASETCDAVEGFMPCTEWADWCPECAVRLWLDPDVHTFGSTAEADGWLSQAARECRDRKAMRHDG